jgi:hypothetical protein
LTGTWCAAAAAGGRCRRRQCRTGASEPVTAADAGQRAAAAATATRDQHARCEQCYGHCAFAAATPQEREQREDTGDRKRGATDESHRHRAGAAVSTRRRDQNIRRRCAGGIHANRRRRRRTGRTRGQARARDRHRAVETGCSLQRHRNGDALTRAHRRAGDARTGTEREVRAGAVRDVDCERERCRRIVFAVAAV